MEKILEKSGKSQGILSVRKSGNTDGIEGGGWLYPTDTYWRPPWYGR